MQAKNLEDLKLENPWLMVEEGIYEVRFLLSKESRASTEKICVWNTENVRTQDTTDDFTIYTMYFIFISFQLLDSLCGMEAKNESLALENPDIPLELFFV